MKLILLLLTLTISLHAFSQNGFELISKAENRYAHGHTNSALRLLDKAEKVNYGFCGNAWSDAKRAIILLRAEIYIQQQEYQLARNSVDAISYGYLKDNFDSIRIRTYQMEYGKDSLSSMIDTSLVNAKVECEGYDCFALIPLTNGKAVKLKLEPTYELIVTDDTTKKAEIWVSWFKKSENFKLLLEKS